jgi:hypothetical protein
MKITDFFRKLLESRKPCPERETVTLHEMPRSPVSLADERQVEELLDRASKQPLTGHREMIAQ